jgi:Spy/CpxP family protein refolding chaperone
MSSKLINIALATIFMFTIAMPAILLAGGNVPDTPITKVLGYKTGLELTDSQIKKLGILDNNFKEKMIQTLAQADIRKREIDKFTANWNNMNGIACCQLVKEYYQFLSELKVLELNAIMQARSVLTAEQIKKFSELANIETMLLDLQPKLSLTF